MPEPPQLEHRPAEPDPPLKGQPATATSFPAAGTAVPNGAGPRAGARLPIGGGVAHPVAEGGGEQAAEARDVPHRHPEGPDAAVALPDAQDDQVPLRMPGDAQPGTAFVEEQIPAGRQRSRALHRSSLGVPAPGFKAPRARPTRGVFHILGGVVQSGFAGG